MVAINFQTMFLGKAYNNFFGYSFFEVETGSMAGTIEIGDWIVVKLDTDYKFDIVNIFNSTFRYQNKKYTLKDIIKMFVKHTLESINNCEDYRKFVYYEE